MSKIIESIDYFPAGSCSSSLNYLFKGLPREKIIFPAGVYLFKHREKGYILYDTGYSPTMKNFSIKYIIYGLATPVSMKESDRIDRLLKNKGIEPNDISYVILSHLHPDHIGGASFFPKAQFIITKDVFTAYKQGHLRSLIFKELLPNDFEQRLEIIKPNQFHSTFPYRETVDLFGDGSVYVASVDGHAVGQACLFLPDYHLFIGADLSWGIDLLPYTEQMRFFPSLVQENKDQYLEGIQLLRRLLSDHYRVLVSHDPEKRVEELIYENRNFFKDIQ